MLEKVDLSKKLEKEKYSGIISDLKLKLGELQRKAKELKIPVIIVFEGWDAAGKGTLINELILPLDPRGFTVFQTNAPNEEEAFRPFLWRFWVRTPLRGRIAIFDRSWYRRVLSEKINGDIEAAESNKAYGEINSFERQLSDDGNAIIKLFLHISKKEQKKRFGKLQDNKSMSWRVTDKDWKHHKQYDEYLQAYDEMLERTDTDCAPWNIVVSHDKRFAEVKMLTVVIEALENKISAVAPSVKTAERHAEVHISKFAAVDSSVLDKVDLSKLIDEDEYQTKLKKYQKQIKELEYELYTKRRPLYILYEGWDAAGKGGNIRRLVQNMDPRGYEVIPISAPSETEKGHHYLWRFWNAVPKAGHIAIFDRTWYGRVLVERVEGFCSEDEWKRAYREINEMEEQFSNSGAVLVKFWLHVSKEEQLRRFEERQQDANKQWKITEEDWRNRDKWDLYKEAVDEMLFRTSTTYAPWTIVESDSKYYARIKALKTVIESVERAI